MIAYLLLAHAVDPQLRMLVETLLSDCRSSVYLHLDKRAAFPRWTEGWSDRLTVVPSVAVQWAGFSMIKATLQLLESATQDAANDYFVLLSGTSFPTRRMALINDQLTDAVDSVPLWTLVYGPGATPTRREICAIEKLHLVDVAMLNPSRGKIRRQVYKLFDQINVALPYRLRIDGPVVKGSQWFAVTKGTAQRFLSEAPGISSLFRRSFAPDEMMLQTIYYRATLAGGQIPTFCAQTAVEQGTHFIRFQAATPAPLLQRMRQTIDRRQLDVNDLNAVLSARAPFARKCSQSLCRALIAAQITPGETGTL